MKPMYINGEWVSSSSGETLDVFDPATAQVIDHVPNGTAEDAVKTIEAAKAAFDEWRWVTALERCEMLHEAARKLRHHFDDVVEVLTREEGKAITENEEEVEWTIGTMDFYAELARNYRGRVVPPAERSQFNFVLKEPYGVVGCIVPFNYPLLLMEGGPGFGRGQHHYHQTFDPHPTIDSAPGRGGLRSLSAGGDQRAHRARQSGR
jgi:acyl-CoA reductase-like NAD-dependent aldehyde dehydrogenase